MHTRTRRRKSLKQRPRPRDRVYIRLMELPGIDAATIAERADLSKGVIEEMASGRLRWDGKAMEAARNLFAELYGDDPEKVGYRFRDRPAVGEVFFQRLLPGGDYVLRVTTSSLRGEPVLDLRLWPLPQRFGGQIEQSGIGMMLPPDAWQEIGPLLADVAKTMQAEASE